MEENRMSVECTEHRTLGPSLPPYGPLPSPISVLRCLLTVPYPHPSRPFAASLRSLTLTHLGPSLPPYGPLPSPISALRCLLTVPYPHPSRPFAASLRSLTLTHLGPSLPPYGPLPLTHLGPSLPPYGPLPSPISALRCLLTVPYPHPSRPFAASLRSLTLTHLGPSLPPYGSLPSPTHLPPTTSLHACYNAMFFQKIHFFDINSPRS